MVPPRSAFLAARTRTVVAVTAMNYAVITYDDREYEVGFSSDSEGYSLTDQGTDVEQRARISISKALLPDRPVRGKMIWNDGRAYEIELIGGDGEGIPDWEVTVFRVPGGDL